MRRISSSLRIEKDLEKCEERINCFASLSKLTKKLLAHHGSSSSATNTAILVNEMMIFPSLFSRVIIILRINVPVLVYRVQCI